MSAALNKNTSFTSNNNFRFDDSCDTADSVQCDDDNNKNSKPRRYLPPIATKSRYNGAQMEKEVLRAKVYPLDFRHYDINDPQELICRSPRVGTQIGKRTQQQQHEKENNTEEQDNQPQQQQPPALPTTITIYKATHLLLACNHLSGDLSHSNQLRSFWQTVVINPEATLTLVDLSSNMLTAVPMDLATLTSLRTLYLHDNLITDVYDTTNRLQQFQSLQCCFTVLTVFGCPIQNNAAYRPHLIQALPILKSLDGTVITPRERETAKVYKEFYINAAVRRANNGVMPTMMKKNNKQQHDLNNVVPSPTGAGKKLPPIQAMMSHNNHSSSSSLGVFLTQRM